LTDRGSFDTIEVSLFWLSSGGSVNKKRWIVVAVLAFMMLFGVSTGMAYVSQTIHQYNGTCSKLTGFPLMLQRMNFLSAGTCKTSTDGLTCTSPNSTCKQGSKPSGNSSDGKCVQQVKGKNNTGCICQ
jgi:hypothetical protein